MRSNKNKLQLGDIFNVFHGMKVYADIPAKFIYSNTPFDGTKCSTELIVGNVYKSSNETMDFLVKSLIKLSKDYSDFNGIKFDKSKLAEAIILPKNKKTEFDSSIYIGEYIVVETAMTGGGTGHGPGDVYPDGWHITAKKLKNGKFDKDGLKISFYQSGCFTVTHEYIPVLRKMKQSFK